MLEVQKYLKNKEKEYLSKASDIPFDPKIHAFNYLTTELAIEATFHETEPLVILNYNQIESIKSNPIVRECRGLVLNSETFALVARAFNRFFNWGEMAEEMPLFNFSNFVTNEKVDGSLVLFYKFNGKLRVNTRGSFAQGPLEGSDMTWEQAIFSALSDENKAWLESLQEGYTYVCEFCSLWNKIVRAYNTPTLFLLSIFQGEDELHWDNCGIPSVQGGFWIPKWYHFTSIEQIEKFIGENSLNDKTFEGLVLRDNKNNRWKVKSQTYLALHRMKGNGNCFLVKNLVPFVLTGESGELLSVYPEVLPKYTEVENKMNTAYAELEKVFLEYKEVENQKDFALGIKGKTSFTGILFTLKKQYGKNATIQNLKEAWRQAGDLIIKVLFD